MHVTAAIALDNSSVDHDALAFLPLNDYPDREAAVAAVLPLVHDAGNPYFDWFFGSTERASAALAALIPLDSPEVAAHRVKLAVAAGEIVGMYLALPGVQLTRCRKADTITLLKELGHDAARRAVLADGADGWVQSVAGVSLLRRRQYEAGTKAWERALQLAPNEYGVVWDVGCDMAHALGTQRAAEGLVRSLAVNDQERAEAPEHEDDGEEAAHAPSIGRPRATAERRRGRAGGR